MSLTSTQNNETLQRVITNSLEGRNAHLEPGKALDGLVVDFTGRKILNTPYTIWQLLKHMNYWQDKFLDRLQDQPVVIDASWTEGWEDSLNAESQNELDQEIEHLLKGITLAKTFAREVPRQLEDNDLYQTTYDQLQAMASHLSYHLAEIILLRRIFGCWPPPSGGMVW